MGYIRESSDKNIPKNINIAVVGPESSGKTSLIKYIIFSYI